MAIIILSSPRLAGFGMEQTNQRHDHRYYVMLDGGRLLNIEDPTRDHEFNDECCIVKISNAEVD